MTHKIDYKKEFKDIYIPKNKPSLIDIPTIKYIMIDGSGSPYKKEYQNALSILYALSFAIKKMSKMNGNQPEGYFDYVVPPLEGLWWSKCGKFDFHQPEIWKWTSIIRQPDFVTGEVFFRAVNECKKKKPEFDYSIARIETFTEGLCVQIMHVGSYSDELNSIRVMQQYMENKNLKEMTGHDRKHHEIYLSDPRRTSPENLKTVLRLPVEYV